MPAKKSNVKVVIVDQNGEFFVQPAVAVLEKDSSPGGGDHDRLKIYNATNEDAVFHISSNIPFGNGVSQTALIGSMKSIVLPVDNGAAANSYPYQVLMVASGKKAKGNSDPMLIIEN